MNPFDDFLAFINLTEQGIASGTFKYVAKEMDEIIKDAKEKWNKWEQENNKKEKIMSFAKELNDFFGTKYSVEKFANGWGKGRQPLIDKFGPYDIVKEGTNGDINRFLIVYKFRDRPDELVAVDGYYDSFNGLDLAGAKFFDVESHTDIFTVYTKKE